VFCFFHTPQEELSDAALANYYADKTCGIMHSASDDEAGLFPEWILNLEAGLLHQGRLVTKKQEAHVITATSHRPSPPTEYHERFKETRSSHRSGMDRQHLQQCRLAS
jgi:hypothetical protein